jgi:hypothetical protein
MIDASEQVVGIVVGTFLSDLLGALSAADVLSINKPSRDKPSCVSESGCVAIAFSKKHFN